MVNTHNDVLKDFDSRLKLFNFKSKFTTPAAWNGTNIVQQVHGKEMGRRYKCTEERLISRLQLWTDVCRIEKIERRVCINGGEKFRGKNTFAKGDYKVKRNKTLSPRPCYIKDLNKSNSSENILSEADITQTSAHKAKSLSLSYSTDNLHGYCTSDSDSTMCSATEELEKTSTHTTFKERFKFFTFRKKTPVKNDKPKSSSKPWERKRRSVKSLNDASERYDDSLDNLDIVSTKVRPSIFSMEALKGNLPRAPKFSSSYDIEKRYCHTDSVSRRVINKSSTVRSVNDRSKSLGTESHYRLTNDNNVAKLYFYDPTIRKTDIGYV